MIDNNLVNSVDISSLPAELQEVISSNPLVFNQALIDGFQKIRDDFEVIESDEKTPLVSFEIQDILQPAKDEFNPTEGAVKWGARLPEFHDIDIDLSLKRSDILSFVRSYLKYVAGVKTQEEALANPWPLFFLQEILQKAGRDLALISAYQGVRDDNGSGAKSVMNGLLFKLAIGRATGGDIKSANVYLSTRTAAEFDANVYEEANKIAQLTENDPDIAGRAMTLEMSTRTYRLYKETRRAKSPNTISISEQPTTLDDYPNIKIKVEPGLGSKRFMWVTLDGNKFFTFNKNYENFSVKLIEDVKGWKANIMFSADVNYGTGRYLYSNNRND
ncbi:hypothetical protein [Siphonobacter sp. SORGH_AS_0500]|uniref:hypothetical protein n=1 Tax=Siphonobacter sp. SORGH_AS_0500 TaxID=1864824 RepID=UPI0028586D7D|nr:hypothetical protein [Siphonobacter sp. SORGH_AS_0500]MDR6195915.1 hypothetical protein [Siphonobacter sp. SORGH_AS_0500]